MITFYDVGKRPFLTPLATVTSFAELPPDSLYSSFRTFGGNKFLYLEEHFARTRRSVARLGWPPLDEPLLRQALAATCSTGMDDVRVRYDYWQNRRLTLALIPFAPPPPAFYRDGVQTAVATAIHRHDPLDKTADFARARTTYLQAHQDDGVYEFLLSDGDTILEGFTSNFYGIRDGVLYTAGEGVLEGITRRIILELLPALDIPLVLQAVALTDLPLLDEAGMSSSSRGFLPITSINGRLVANGRPGPLSQKIMQAYDAFVANTVETAVSA